MKIIEGLKKVKRNKARIEGIYSELAANAARMENTRSPYGEDPAPERRVEAWLQEAKDLIHENSSLLSRIYRTNMATEVAVEVAPGQTVTKTITEWIFRRDEGASLELRSWSALAVPRGMVDTTSKNDEGKLEVIHVKRHFDQTVKDQTMFHLSQESSLIDAQLEIANATVDLLE